MYSCFLKIFRIIAKIIIADNLALKYQNIRTKDLNRSVNKWEKVKFLQSKVKK